MRRKIKDFLRQRSTKIGTSDCTTAIPTGDTCVKFVRCFQRSQEYLPKAVPEVTIQQEYKYTEQIQSNRKIGSVYSIFLEKGIQVKLERKTFNRNVLKKLFSVCKFHDP